MRSASTGASPPTSAGRRPDDLDGFIAHELFVPTGIASDGSRFWITTENDLDIFAFNYLGLPDATRNITPDSDNGNPTYMWADRHHPLRGGPG